MKQLILATALLIFTTTIHAQSTAGTVVVDKQEQAAAVIELPYEADLVSKALNDYLSGKGKAKGREMKGFKAYKNPNEQADSVNANLYFSVRSKKDDKDATILSLLITRKGNEIATGSDMHHMNMEEARHFLDALAPVIAAYSLEARIADQENVVAKAASKYKDLVEDGKDLQEKKAETEKKIMKNEVDQAEQQAKLETERARLNALISSKKS